MPLTAVNQPFVLYSGPVAAAGTVVTLPTTGDFIVQHTYALSGAASGVDWLEVWVNGGAILYQLPIPPLGTTSNGIANLVSHFSIGHPPALFLKLGSATAGGALISGYVVAPRTNL